MYITREKFEEICKKHDILSPIDEDAKKALCFVHELLETEAKAIQEREPDATASIDRLKEVAYEVYSIYGEIDNEEFAYGQAKGIRIWWRDYMRQKVFWKEKYQKNRPQKMIRKKINHSLYSYKVYEVLSLGRDEDRFGDYTFLLKKYNLSLIETRICFFEPYYSIIRKKYLKQLVEEKQTDNSSAVEMMLLASGPLIHIKEWLQRLKEYFYPESTLLNWLWINTYGVYSFLESIDELESYCRDLEYYEENFPNDEYVFELRIKIRELKKKITEIQKEFFKSYPQANWKEEVCALIQWKNEKEKQSDKSYRVW